MSREEVVYVRIERCPVHRPEERVVEEAHMRFNPEMQGFQRVRTVANAAENLARRMWQVATRPEEGGRG